MSQAKATPKGSPAAPPAAAPLTRDEAVAAMLADLPGLDPLPPPPRPAESTLRLRLPADPAPDLIASVRQAVSEHGLCVAHIQRFQCLPGDVLVLQGLRLATTAQDPRP